MVLLEKPDDVSAALTALLRTVGAGVPAGRPRLAAAPSPPPPPRSAEPATRRHGSGAAGP